MCHPAPAEYDIEAWAAAMDAWRDAPPEPVHVDPPQDDKLWETRWYVDPPEWGTVNHIVTSWAWNDDMTVRYVYAWRPWP